MRLHVSVFVVMLERLIDVSFVLMRQRDINESLTTEHHFAQEGFQQLLSP
jgi:hypothetical protein